MKKYQIIPALVLLCALLSGCCMSHEWQKATCEAPKTCINCGKTEGNALGHSWGEATCEAAKTCTGCGAIEGIPLDHTWKEANYQSPKTCIHCGKTDGEPLPPAFETMEVKGKWIEADEPYDYITACFNDDTKKTTGKLMVTYHPEVSGVGLEEKEGYIWKMLEVTITFMDDNAWKYGWSIRECFEDYYDIIGHDNSSSWNEDGSTSTFTVNWNGSQYDACKFQTSSWVTGWVNHKNSRTAYYEYRVPIGYDGVVLGFYDSSIEWGEGDYIFDVADENTLFFRLN